ncbi:hypothetical protein EMIHUDRAFT_244064 [Emiliania huxleyi CCMP1516]|uniref:Uncharacterized protein n=2 Tax=Emiliania huxleyi TaxID=2903 RepID=A0A0D3J1Y3_EMIH1|nr:hypothetical protein EMIHUDRAFT_244064 [Emiliania huxleyi CCMP1516]EOD17518.1 hypothetical protein EMIHUDRAFT_244064 [Emiliania huxleyi CCMP1516]|eukprot:XP_005769947.1 hypothetical protein EMIHUDRAFT_244064 [Emiliania huxleyi CCMP1516]
MPAARAVECTELTELYDNFVYSVEADTMGFYTSSISSVEASLGPPTDDCKPNGAIQRAGEEGRQATPPRDRPGKARDPPFPKNRGAPPNRENRPKPSAGGAKV